MISFAFFTVPLLESLKDQRKAGEKCSKYRSYDLAHQRDWKSLKFLKFEMVCCLKSNSLKSKKQLHSFPSIFAAGLWWTRFSWSRNGHETPAPSHFKTRMAYLGGDVWTFAAKRLWCLQCRPLSVALQGHLIVSTSNKTMEDRIT